ncbi:hypothetical protein SETIT_4G151900v2 [Setaria italica]|uniref:CCHC-type domain-containing protein n=1 Tax=Setaria italica TaxID=4555 RepID=K3Y389_SETIT|nr:hypothetical protein SETIT_4G151900v2 [Setaria italica]
MSTTSEVPFEPLDCDDSNYTSWSAHILNTLRTMGPSFEQILVASILSPRFNIDHIGWFKTTQKELECSQLNACIFRIFTFDIEEVRNDAHLIWKLLIATYATPECNNKDQVKEKALEECSTSCEISMHSQVSLLVEKEGQKDQDTQRKKKVKKGKGQKIEASSSLSKELELLKSDHASLVSKHDSLAKDYACITKSLSCVASLETANEELKAQLGKLTSEHMALQVTHKELECFHGRILESYAILDITHEVVITSVKSIQPLTHTYSCSQVEINSFSTNPCCSQEIQSSIEHVFVESCDDLVAQSNDELMKESKIQEEKKFEHIKCFNCSKIRHFASRCPNKLTKKETHSKRERSHPKQRICYKCKEKGHIGVACTIAINGDETDPDRFPKPVRPIKVKEALSHSSKKKEFTPLANVSGSKYRQEKQNNTVSRKDKTHICYTCQQKDQMGKDCSNGNILNSNLVHYNFSNLRNDKVGTCAIRVIDSPRTSIRAIWIPKHLLTNLHGPKKIGTDYT